MRSETAPAEAGWPNRSGQSARARATLSTVVYRSRAVADMSPPQLQDLTRVAQARNGREAITGLMLYDGGQFFQWLEGPEDGVDRVMSSICQDKRHTNIEILNNQRAHGRTFGDWNMKLATPGASKTWQDAIEPPREVVEGLRARPDAAPSLLVKMVPGAQAVVKDSWGLEASRQAPLSSKAAAILKTVILSSVIPKLLGQDDAPLAEVGSTRAAELAELLIAGDESSAQALLRELHAAAGSAGVFYSSLVEPAARSLGDMWNEDVCSEVDLTIGLCRLQSAARLLASEKVSVFAGRPEQPAVLIVPEPGEIHSLGASLDGRMLENAGWAPHCEFPADDRALEEMVSGTWFDVLDMSLSVALRQESWLPRLKESIAQARRASKNPALVVLVGGRVFAESKAAGEAVGADVASTTSGTVERSILRTVSTTGTRTVTATPS